MSAAVTWRLSLSTGDGLPALHRGCRTQVRSRHALRSLHGSLNPRTRPYALSQVRTAGQLLLLMERLTQCPKCCSSDLYESCYSTHPFRMTFCRCGWDNLDEVIRASGRQILNALLAAQAMGVLLPGFTPEEMEQGILNLRDPEREATFIASIRGA